MFDPVDPYLVNNETDVSRFVYNNILRNVFPCREFQFLSEYQIPRSGIPDYALTNNGI